MILFFLKGSKLYFLGTVFFAAAVSLLDLLNPRIISFTVDSVLGSEAYQLPAPVEKLLQEAGGTVYLREHLWIIALLILGVAILGAVCRFLFKLFNALGAEKLVQTMRDSLFGHILKLPFSWLGENHTGDIIQRCTSDVEQIKVFLSEQLTGLFRVFVLVAFALYFMFSINLRLALAVAAFIPVIVGYSLYFYHRVGDAFEKVDVEEGVLSSIAQENLTGVRVVRAFGRELYEKERFETQNEKYTKMWIYLMRLLSAFWMSSDLISYLQILTVFIYGAFLSVRGELTPGNYIAFITYTTMLMWPIRSLGRIISNMSKAGISIDRLRYIMNAEPEEDRPGAEEAEMSGDIAFEHVSFRYENGTADVLEDVSLQVKAGTTVGILGGTGSGKSTLMYLLDRLYELPEDGGRITIGGKDIRDIRADWLRKNIGMVLQEPFLFSRTLSENIAIASRNADQTEVRHAARLAALDETIEHFTEGYETCVGERGVTLSGGQKQRTAIAQMLIRKPPIMVFDDSLSAVDAETDAKIRKALAEELAGSTVILIAHRITTLMQADRIYVMDKGRIAEEGTHAELLAKGGIYSRIYELQSRQA
ncbi:MAG: ABC transporter ATP-binding protein [Lachnospiraceae bacterium]|nr:ABC transporter ATP-binding protein [Lachnospiraceae bacterium]